MSDYSSELDSMRVQIHFKENSIPSVHAGLLTDESKAQLLALLQRVEVEGRIDELQRLKTGRHYGKDYQESLDELDEYKCQRLEALQSSDKGGE